MSANLLPSPTVLRGAIAAALARHGATLGAAVTDEQAVPSYLRGSALSRVVFWGKLRHIVRAAAVEPGETLLDFGCGTGILLPTWAGRGARVIATDLHLELARDLVQQVVPGAVEFRPSDAWAAAIPPRSLDVVVAANVLEHVADRPALYATFRSKLKPGGRLVISGPTENALYRLGRRLIGFRGDYHVTTIHELLEEAEAAGFRRVWERRYPVPGPGCLYRVARLTE